MKLEEYSQKATCCAHPDLYYQYDKHIGGGSDLGAYRESACFKCANCHKFHLLHFDREENIIKKYIMEEV